MEENTISSPIHCLILYEKVSLKTPLEQRRFFNYLDDTCRELLSLYPHAVSVNADRGYTPADDLSDMLNIKGIFIPAIVDNILYLSGLGDVLKSEFLRKAKAAATSGRKRVSNIIKRNKW